MFKVTAHPIPKCSLWVRYKPDWAKGREDLLRTKQSWTDKWTEGGKDRRTD